MSENYVLSEQPVLFAPPPEVSGFVGVHRLIAERAARTPQAPALVCGGCSVGYGELGFRTAALARRLRTLGVGPEVVVAVYLDRSPEALVALLGILRAGGTYLPLDPDYPRERLTYMLQDSGAAVLLTREDLRGDLPGEAPWIITLDGMGDGIMPAAADIDGVDPSGLAYILYTSGSTGRPKAVGVSHAALLHHARAMSRAYRLVPRDRVLQFTSLSFDVAAEEVFPSLAAGAAVVLLPEARTVAPCGLVSLIERERLTVLNLPSPYWHEWVDALADGGERLPACLRLVVVGSDRVSPHKLAAWRDLLEKRESLAEWVNAYGLTESTVTSTLFRLPRRQTGVKLSPVPIGQPVGEARAQILDLSGNPVPEGVVGELWLGGPGLARGYLGRPELTADRFRPDPEEAGARLLRTGDLARLRPDGHLELLERADSQIKIRGFRLEPGEIEAALCEHPAVREAVVLSREAADGNQRLAACLVLSPAVPSRPRRELLRELRERLSRTLPEPMVPSDFAFLEALPRTANGKLDRRALARVELSAVEREDGDFVAPRAGVEETLAGIWASLLGVAKIDARDDFFQLGGHSLLATRLVSRLRAAFGVDLSLREIFAEPTLAGLARRLAEACSARGPFSTAAAALLPQPRTRGVGLPLSFAQQRLWLLDRLQPGSSRYNVPVFFRIRGRGLDAGAVGALGRALDEVVRRHEALRTSFTVVDAEPVQRIEPHRPLGLPLVDLSGLPETARRREAARVAAEEAARPFDLSRSPLLRSCLVRLAAGEHALLVDMHHIASDGWSVGVLAAELTALYRAFAAGRPSPLPELPVQYADYAVWQRRWLTGETLASQLAYWRGQLVDLPPLDLPVDRPRPAAPTFRGAVEGLQVGSELLTDLERISRQHGATLFMTLLAAWQALLGRYAGQQDFGVGTPVANRNRSEIEGLIGFFVNTLVLRADLAGRPAFAELLARVREAALAAYSHQDLPFERLVEDLAPERSLSRNPLFQAAFAFQNVPTPDLDLGPGLQVVEEEPPVATSRFDLSLFVTERRGRLAVDLEYSADLFVPATARQFLAHYRTLLAAIVAAPSTGLEELPLLSAGERLELLVECNRTRREFPAQTPVHRLFEAQAARTPEAVAVVSGAAGGERLTYEELNRWANRLAHRLRSLAVGPDVPVAVVLERSVEMVVAILAVLKAGGAYVPLDPRDPAERLAYVLDDTQASVVVGRPGDFVAAGLHEHGPRALFFVDVHGTQGAQLPSSWDADLAGAEVDGENLAYVIYTSGSTGRPKGVAVPHRGIGRLVVNTDYVQLGPQDRVGHLSNPAFDAAVFEVWGALLNGAALVVVPREVALSPAALSEMLAAEWITTVFLTTALFNQMGREAPQAFAPLRHLLFGGEAVDPGWVRAVRGGTPPERLLHVYGPTESTTFTTWHEVGAVLEGDTVPIGRPLANTRVYVLDRELEPVPAGVRGELCTGGDGLARGYWNRPDLTAERFVPDPAGVLAGEPGARMYRSGDLVRRRRDGAVEFVGRTDHQVKIRGFRIEPGEIEAALAAHPQVAGTLVMAREDVPGDRRLVAYVMPRGAAPEGCALRIFLEEKLPHYMVPSRFLFLSEFPLNANGKVDRRALPAPEPSRPELDAVYVPPRTPLERQVAEAWAEVLGLDRVGLNDSFWELGGHSLLATKVLSRLYDALGVELPLQALFESPTLASFSESLAHSVLAASGEEGERFLEELAEMSDEEVLSLLGESDG